MGNGCYKAVVCLMFASLLLFTKKIKAQDNEARLTVLIGSHIEFNFNTLDKYTNGIRIPNGTTFGIHMVDLTGGTLLGWHIDFQSFLAQPTIDGSNIANTLPLNTIQVEATDANGNLGTAVFTGLQDLAISPGHTLMSTTDPAHIPANENIHQINLSYECGIANGSLLGASSDYYTVEIEVILIPDF